MERKRHNTPLCMYTYRYLMFHFVFAFQNLLWWKSSKICWHITWLWLLSTQCRRHRSECPRLHGNLHNILRWLVYTKLTRFLFSLLIFLFQLKIARIGYQAVNSWEQKFGSRHSWRGFIIRFIRFRIQFWSFLQVKIE